MNFEEVVSKEHDAQGTYRRRVVRTSDGQIRSDERIKCDPVLHFTPPDPISIRPDTGDASIIIAFELRDFDGSVRKERGLLHWSVKRVGGSEAPTVFTRELGDGAASLAFASEVPGVYVFSLVPPFVADLQLFDEVRIEVQQ